MVIDLLESEGKTAIAVFVDRLTKMTHLVPCTKEITATQYAQLFIDNVYPLYGMPKVIISDEDPRCCISLKGFCIFCNNLFSLNYLPK